MELKPDLIVLDIGMPILNGPAAGKAKAPRRQAGLPDDER